MTASTKAERGRPLGFDPEQALEQALQVFWRMGFDSASLSELTAAMGINKPSLYAAFGDKESLYLRAMERYATQRLGPHFELLEREPQVRRAVEQFLRSLVDMFTRTGLPGGCFLINGCADLGAPALPKAIDAGLNEVLDGGEKLLKARLDRGRREGQLPASISTGPQAAYLMSVVAGLAVMAKRGARSDKLNAVVDATLSNWPG
jgi:AcrR family transcriptional regulator